MNTKIILHTALASFLLAPAALAQIQTLQLRSGEVVLGRVTDVGDQEVQVQVSYPQAEQRTIAREEIAPLSLWNTLAARTAPDDAQAHLALARQARELGLQGQAIAALREAQRLDDALKGKAQEQIDAIRSELAQQLLAEGRKAVEEGRRPAAHLMLQAIADRYGDTPAAEEAANLRRRMSGTTTGTTAGDRADSEAADAAADAGDAGGADTTGKRRLDADELQKLLQDARQRFEQVARTPVPPAPSSVQHQRLLERRVELLEPVYRTMTAVAKPAEAQLAQELQQVQTRAKRELIDSYVGLGSILAQRQAFPEAQSYAEKACGIDPDSQGCHRIYRLIELGRTLGGRF